MEKIWKRMTIWSCIVMMTVGVLHAQDRKPHISPEEFKARLEGFIIKESQLTQEEAGKLFPLFHEMRTKQRESMEQINELKRKHTALDNDKECSALINRINELKVTAARLEYDYYKSMCKILPAHKVYAVMRAEDKFHRNMFKRLSRTEGKGKEHKR